MSYQTTLSLICSSGAAAYGCGGGTCWDSYACEGAIGTISQTEYGPEVPWVFDYGVGAVIYFTMPTCSWPPLNEGVITNLVIQAYGALVTQFGGLKISVSFDGGSTWHSVGNQGAPFDGNINISAYNVTLAQLSNIKVAIYIGNTGEAPYCCPDECENCNGSGHPLYGCVCPADTFAGGVQLVITSSSPLEFSIEPTIVVTEECCCVCA